MKKHLMIAVPLLMAAFLAPQAYAAQPGFLVKIEAKKHFYVKFSDTETIADLVNRIKETAGIHNKALWIMGGRRYANEEILGPLGINLHNSGTARVMVADRAELESFRERVITFLISCNADEAMDPEKKLKSLGENIQTIAFIRKEMAELDAVADASHN